MLRSNGTPFELTQWEKDLLALRRAGLSYREIMQDLGLSKNCSLPNVVSRAIEKERIILLNDKRHYGVSSLLVARGGVRMKGTK